MSSTAALKKGFADEIKLIRRIKHINIVLCYGAGISRDGSLFLVLEFCSRGSLNTILRSMTAIELKWSLKYDIGLHVGRGLEYLHNMTPISLHRDIKSPNVMVSEGWIAKLGDFGSAKLVDGEAAVPRSTAHTKGAANREATTCHGSPLWSAPEVLEGKSYTTHSDVYRCVVDVMCADLYLID